MTIQFKLGISLGLIVCLLAMALLPTETQSTPLGWVGYGIIIGLLLITVLRAISIISYQTSYNRRKTYNTRSRYAQGRSLWQSALRFLSPLEREAPPAMVAQGMFTD